MKVLMISCSRNGYVKMTELKREWEDNDTSIEISDYVKCKSLPEISMEEEISELVWREFEQVDAIVFVCASGIAVRSIAPCIQHKSKDPAVIVIDELGTYCISLLSGHVGGANALAKQISKLIDATPIITTATDIEHRFSVDDFARRQGLVISDWKLAKGISASVLEGDKIKLYPYKNSVEDGMYSKSEQKKCLEAVNIKNISAIEETVMEQADDWVVITDQEMDSKLMVDYHKKNEDRVLCLIPKVIVIGIGCRKGTPKAKIEATVLDCLDKYGIWKEAVRCVASIDIKSQEQGILEYCFDEDIEFKTFSADELNAIEGDFSNSDFVKEVTGVSNVCERSALAACKGQQGLLICKKMVYDGVTIALALDWGDAE